VKIKKKILKVLGILKLKKILNYLLKVGDCRIGILCTDKTEISKMDLCYKKNKNNKQNKASSK
jgi:hypothetical protein